MWENSLKLDTAESLHQLLSEHDCHADLVIGEIAKDETKAELIANTNNAVEKGAFGIPTFFIGDEMFFGKESLREIRDLASK